VPACDHFHDPFIFIQIFPSKCRWANAWSMPACSAGLRGWMQWRPSPSIAPPTLVMRLLLQLRLGHGHERVLRQQQAAQLPVARHLLDGGLGLTQHLCSGWAHSGVGRPCSRWGRGHERPPWWWPGRCGEPTRAWVRRVRDRPNAVVPEGGAPPVVCTCNVSRLARSPSVQDRARAAQPRAAR